jgi:6-phosphogluconate dehydrogenase
MVMPLLELYTAKYLHGKPCAARIGPHISGHYVKIVYNAFEGGMLLALKKVRSFMHDGLGFDYEVIAGIFAGWNSHGELWGNYLLKIAVDMLRTKNTVSGTEQHT